MSDDREKFVTELIQLISEMMKGAAQTFQENKTEMILMSDIGEVLCEYIEQSAMTPESELMKILAPRMYDLANVAAIVTVSVYLERKGHITELLKKMPPE